MSFLVPDCQYELHVGAFGQHGMSLVHCCSTLSFDSKREGPSPASHRTDTLLACLAPARSCSGGLCRCNATTSPSSPTVHVRCYGAHGCSRRYG